MSLVVGIYKVHCCFHSNDQFRVEIDDREHLFDLYAHHVSRQCHLVNATQTANTQFQLI